LKSITAPTPSAGDDGKYLYYVHGSTSYALGTPAGAGNVSSTSNITDHVIVRGDGGAKNVQATGVTIDDSNNVTGIVNLGATGTRVTKIWATDLEVTNNITGNLLTLSAFTTDHTWTTTDAVVVTIAESAGLFGLLYLHSTGYKKAKADAVATLPCVALQCTAGTGAQTVIKRGYARDASWTWTKGLPLWVSAATAGAMTQTQPGSGKWVQFVGYAEETNVIYFNPSPVWVEVP
jgi:hypothetical protein